MSSQTATSGWLRRLPGWIAGVGGVVFLALGLWAFLRPDSFYPAAAPFPPFNEHFLRDSGAFKVGLGVVLLVSLRSNDALLVALVGTGTGAAFHALSHVIDRHAGGRPELDVPALTVLAVLLLIGAFLRQHTLERQQPD